MASRQARVLRGLTAAGLATFVAALFHVAGGGMTPSGLALTVTFVASTFVSIALAGRRLSLVRLALSVGISQFLFHILFAMSPAGVRISGPAGVEHIHAGMHLAVSGGGDAMAGMGMSGPSMWLSHLGAAVVTIAVLRHGEKTFWRLYEFTAFRVEKMLASAALIPMPTRAVVRAESRPIILRDLSVVLGRMRHRGPPVRMSALA